MENLKALIIGDIHVHPHENDWSRVNNALEAFSWALDIYEENNCNHLFFLGDWQHNKKIINCQIIDKSRKLIEIAASRNIRMSLLAGNHDCSLIIDPDFSFSWVSSECAHIINKPILYRYNDVDIYCLPWYGPIDRAKDIINQLINKKNQISDNKPTYFLGHLDLFGGRQSGSHKSEHGITPKLLSNNFNWSFLGHYHIRHFINNNILYVGSLLTTRFNEEGPKGVTIIENGNIKFIENTISPKHITMHVSQINEKSQDLIKNNYVRVRCSNDDNINKIEKIVKKMGALKTQTIIDEYQLDEENGKLVLDKQSFELTNEVILQKWIKMTCPPGLDEQKLYETGKNILDEVGLK